MVEERYLEFTRPFTWRDEDYAKGDRMKLSSDVISFGEASSWTTKSGTALAVPPNFNSMVIL